MPAFADFIERANISIGHLGIIASAFDTFGIAGPSIVPSPGCGSTTPTMGYHQSQRRRPKAERSTRCCIRPDRALQRDRRQVPLHQQLRHALSPYRYYHVQRQRRVPVARPPVLRRITRTPLGSFCFSLPISETILSPEENSNTLIFSS